MPEQRRDRLSIIAEILIAAKEGERKTQIMYKARLSFAQLESYLSSLITLKLIKEEGGTWETTERGNGYLEAFSKVKPFVRDLYSQ